MYGFSLQECWIFAPLQLAYHHQPLGTCPARLSQRCKAVAFKIGYAGGVAGAGRPLILKAETRAVHLYPMSAGHKQIGG